MAESFLAKVTTAAVNTAVADAKNLPELVSNLQVVAPQLAAPFFGKALLASKSPWGTLAAGLVSYTASKYGFGWPPELCAAVAGGGVLLGSYAMRLFTKQPITSLLPSAVIG